MTHIQIQGKRTGALPLAAAWALFALLLTAPTVHAAPLDLTYTAYRMDRPNAPPVKEGELIRGGEKLLIKIRYVNDAPSAAQPGDLVLTLPSGCAFVQSPNADRLAVSVDGGREFGALEQLYVAQNGRLRAATGEDVTHIRVSLDRPIAPGESGEISIVAAQD